MTEKVVKTLPEAITAFEGIPDFLLRNADKIFFIILTLVLWLVIDKVIKLVITRLFKAAGKRAGETVFKDDDIRKAWVIYRMSTLRQLVTQALRALLAAVVFFSILDIIGINIKPILAGVGIAGLGVSLAAQNLIRDYINGILIVIEDQYNVNDWIQIGNYQGSVEYFTLRLTRLRSLEGNLIIIPNSTVQGVINYTKDWAYASIYVTIPYEEDYPSAKQIMKELCDEIVGSGDPKIFPNPVFNGITDFSNDGVKFRCFIKTAPGYQWSVGYNLREELHKRFTAAGIKFAYPSVNNHFDSLDRAMLAQIAESRRVAPNKA